MKAIDETILKLQAVADVIDLETLDIESAESELDACCRWLSARLLHQQGDRLQYMNADFAEARNEVDMAVVALREFNREAAVKHATEALQFIRSYGSTILPSPKKT